MYRVDVRVGAGGVAAGVGATGGGAETAPGPDMPASGTTLTSVARYVCGAAGGAADGGTAAGCAGGVVAGPISGDLADVMRPDVIWPPTGGEPVVVVLEVLPVAPLTEGVLEAFGWGL